MDPIRGARLRELRNAFLLAHREGMAALESGDGEAFRDVLRREREILDEQLVLINQEQAEARAFLDDCAARFLK